jgi:hypothetical protein
MNLITLKVLVTGDFHQLPPVAIGKSLRYAFEARCWSQLIEVNTLFEYLCLIKSLLIAVAHVE